MASPFRHYSPSWSIPRTGESHQAAVWGLTCRLVKSTDERIHCLRWQGWSQQQIADATGRSHSTVRRCVTVT